MRTELPEKWFILYKNREQFNIINEFYNKGWGYSNVIDEAGYSTNFAGNNWTNGDENFLLSKGVIKLTWEEFEILVLKKQPELPIYEIY